MRLIACALVFIAALPLGALAGPAQCPSDAVEIGRKEFDRQIVLTCRCGVGLMYLGGRCMPRDEVLKQAQAGFRAMAAGALGQALKEEAQLDAYALAKNWSPTDLSAVLLSVLAADRAKFDRARGYLANMELLKSDQIVAALAKLLEAKDTDMQVQRSVDSQVEALIRDINGRQQADALRDIVEASMLRGQGRYDEAIVLYERARATMPQQSAEMLNVLNDTIAMTRSIRAQMDYKLAPEQWDKYYRQARERASAEHAWALALALNEAGLKKQSVELYKDAIASMQIAQPKLVGVLSKQMDDAASRTQPSSDTFRSLYRSDRYTQNDALFDALDYGKGDWKRSLDFLTLAVQMDPNNEKFQYAIKKLGELNVSSK